MSKPAAEPTAACPLRILLVSNHRRFKINFRAHPWARALAKRGHEVDVLCHANTERWRTRIEHVDGFRIIENPDLLVGALRQGWDPYCAWRRWRFLKHEDVQYDIIHCLDTRLAVIWPALAYARAKGIPIVSDWIDWWGRGGLIAKRRPWWYRFLFAGIETWFEEHYRAQLDGLTTISHALLERGVRLGCSRDRAIVIHGGADMATFSNVPAKADAKRALDLNPDAPVLCFSGLDVLIDLPLAIHAYERVRREVPETQLLLVGPTAAHARPLLTNPAAWAGVKALGPIPFAKLPEHLAAADIFLTPYSNEIANIGRWPNKVGDYMAVGRPIVSNPVGEVKWLFDTYAVGVLADETPDSVADAVLALLRDPKAADAIGRQARRVAETVFAWDQQIFKLERWYYMILDGLSEYKPHSNRREVAFCRGW
jgi:glycosyltransferase involved in cell wall biosynthesis